MTLEESQSKEIKRLRDFCLQELGQFSEYQEALDEIERLKAENEGLKDLMKQAKAMLDELSHDLAKTESRITV